MKGQTNLEYPNLAVQAVAYQTVYRSRPSNEAFYVILTILFLPITVKYWNTADYMAKLELEW